MYVSTSPDIQSHNVKGVDIRAGAVQAEQLRGAAECVPQRLHAPRHQPGPQEGDATPINLNYVDVDWLFA